MGVTSDVLKTQSVIVVSDVHVDEWPEEIPQQHEEKRQAFLEFLRWVKDDSGAQHLVINGDLVDIPQKDGTPLLPAFFDIFHTLIELYRSGIGISYIIGNHDSGILGFSSDIRQIPLTINYPYLVLESGDVRMLIEHGHLLDAWLWAYVEHRLSFVCTTSPPTPENAMRQFIDPNSAPAQVDLPPAHAMADQLFASLQWEPNGLDFTETETRLAISLMALDLFDDFEDVRADGEVFSEKDLLLPELQELGVTPEQLCVAAEIPKQTLEAFRMIGDVYYAKIPWRRAARYRLKQLNNELGNLISTIVLGHIHKIDHMQWDENGQQRDYHNAGSWKNNKADFLHLENGQVTMYERLWTDPLP